MKYRILLAIASSVFTAMFFGGFFYGFLLAGFFKNEMSNVPHGILTEIPSMWLITFSYLAPAVLFCWLFIKKEIYTFTKGLLNGLIIGFLITIYVELMWLASFEFYTIKKIAADIFCSTFILASMGGVIAPILGIKRK